MTSQATLYGIRNSNRDPKKFWGKNMFNSSFPVSLAAYMRDNDIKVNYIVLNEDLTITCKEVTVDEIFNTVGMSSDDIFYSFETKFDTYQQYAYDDIGNIDLVIKDTSGSLLRALEVKMTVIPDNSTHKFSEDNWGSEIVFRPASTSYCALGILDSCESDLNTIRNIFEPICSEVESWSNSREMLSMKNDFLNAIDSFERIFYNKQKPFIMQPIWKTKNKSPFLADQAFDIFVWSDFAFTRLFLDFAKKEESKDKTISRQLRSSIRLARCLYEVSKSGKVRIEDIYTKMAFGNQTDKAFAVPGRVTNSYMKSKRLTTPELHKNVVFDVILNGGEHKLSPERRLDQTLYFTMFNNHK